MLKSNDFDQFMTSEGIDTLVLAFTSKTCSENKGADQRRGYREADLRICFLICRKPIFSRRGSIIIVYKRQHEYIDSEKVQG